MLRPQKFDAFGANGVLFIIRLPVFLTGGKLTPSSPWRMLRPVFIHEACTEVDTIPVLLSYEGFLGFPVSDSVRGLIVFFYSVEVQEPRRHAFGMVHSHVLDHEWEVRDSLRGGV